MQPHLHYRSRLLPLVLLTLIGGGAYLRPAPAVYREFYVSPTGADTNSGTEARPLRTLAHARDVVRTINRKVTGDIVVYLRGGVYPVTAPIEFQAADSGRNGFHVIYRAFANEAPIVSGGVPVTGWKLDHGKVYRAKLNWDGKLRSLYVNGVRARPSRGVELKSWITRFPPPRTMMSSALLQWKCIGVSWRSSTIMSFSA